jgi:hypothetical protein
MKDWLKALLSETAFSVWWILSALSTLCTFFVPALAGKWRLVSVISAVVGFALANYRVFQKQGRRISTLSAAGASDAARTSHLAQIKQEVVESVLPWLEGVVASLQGGPGATNSLLWIGTEPIAKQAARVDEWPYDYAWTIKPAPTLWEPGAAGVLGSGIGTGGILSSAIFSDAERRHFVIELSQLRAFLSQWRAFLSDVTALATDSAKSLQSKTDLPHSPASRSVDEFADADYLVATCLRRVLSGSPLHLRFDAVPQSGLVTVRDPDNYSLIMAQGRDEGLLRAWIEEGTGYFKEQWERSGLPDRVRSLLGKARDVRAAIESIRLKHFLPGDCEYVGS